MYAPEQALDDPEYRRDYPKRAICGAGRAGNAGKSNLLILLAGRKAAIVSDRAGTTRDVIEVKLSLAGIPIRLADTLGLRETTDYIEAEGINEQKMIKEADLVVLARSAVSLTGRILPGKWAKRLVVL